MSRPKIIIPSPSIKFGCDPEFFFAKGGKVIESEKVIPKQGLTTEHGYGRVIIDGVQAELNPLPSTCREGLAGAIIRCFMTLHDTIKKDKDLKVNFAQNIKLTKKDFDDLSEKSKKLGCKPSLNSYNDGKETKISVNPEVYRGRSAGGHIHLGMRGTVHPHDRVTLLWRVLRTHKPLVDLLDIIVGNTCVLIDRDKGNKIRRKVYGRAGEFRLPKHGLEYRTLSNFWLRSYQLMSLVMGLARHAVNLEVNNFEECDWADAIRKSVNMKDIQKAINENDFVLAKKNYNKYIDLLVDSVSTQDGQHGYYPITKENKELFDHFIIKGIDYWFKEDPLEHWLKLSGSRLVGFHEFMRITVLKDKHPVKAKIKEVKDNVTEALKEM